MHVDMDFILIPKKISNLVAMSTTVCDKVCQWLETGQWFSPSTQVSSTNKTDRQDVAEILLKWC